MLELVLRLGLSLAVVLGLFWAVARVGSRKMGRTAGLVKVRSRQSLSRTASLAVVEVGGRVLVVGVGDGGVRLLTELDAEDLEQPQLPVQTTSPAPAAQPLQRVPTGNRINEDVALAGSVLSPQTWKQAWSAATTRTPVRRGAHAAYPGAAHD